MTTENSSNLLLPNALERRQMFYLLKKHSSWTAWNHILGCCQKWADIAKESLRQADNNRLKSGLTHRDYVNITRAVALFDKGVRRLAKGDKRVFSGDEGTNFFGRAEECTRYLQTTKHRLDDGEIRWDGTPLVEEFFKALDDWLMAKRECADVRPDDPAKSCYYLWHMIFLPHFPYPDPLPEVPEPVEIVEVKTGEKIPWFGIWEPIEGSVPIGAMNYLHGGRRAPKLKQAYRDISDQDSGYIFVTVDATWRSLWRDNRYKDGTIPLEEQNYQFLEPRPPNEWGFYRTFVETYLRVLNLPNPLLEGVRYKDMRCDGGEVCPHDGWWWTPASHEGKGRFKKGDVMPNYTASSYGATIWYRVRKA